MLASWDHRPQYIKALFNPAFTAAMICVATRGYDQEVPESSGLPLIMSYLILPLALHSETRNTLPATTATSLTHWIGNKPQIHIGLTERVHSFRGITCEAIRFAVAGGIVDISDAGGLKHVPRRPVGLDSAKGASPEVKGCFKAAQDLGRWFARVPDVVFLFHTLGIRL